MNHLKNKKIVIIAALFNKEIVDKTIDGAISALNQKGIMPDDIIVKRVAGALEIPFASQVFAKNNTVAGIITLGVVIRGETAHFDVVANESLRATMDVSLKYDKPITFGVILAENNQQAFARAGGKEGNRGVDAAQALLMQLALTQAPA